jgi:hypothetical protein
VPVGDILVCDTRGNIEHNDTALSVDVVAITKTTEFLLTSCVPDVELNLSKVLCVLLVCLVAQRRIGERTVVKPRGWTSTPRVAMYFFSNSPVKWRLTKVVCNAKQLAFVLDYRHIALLFAVLLGVIRGPKMFSL